MTDKLFKDIAGYVLHFKSFSEEALNTAHLALFDSLGCAMQALKFPACKERLGPFFPDTTVHKGCRVPGTKYVLDPIQATFNLGAMIRWLDYNDTWLAREWGHPSDNFSPILMCSDWVSQRKSPLLMKSVLEAAIQAYEIQGILALSQSFNQMGFDHVILVKVASSALATKILGGRQEALLSALSNAFCDAGPLRLYRHAPNTGPRKSWAAADAAARGVFLAERALRGEMSYGMALTAPKWGVSDVFFKGKPVELAQPLDNYVMENILFKIAFPAEFHAQTAVEAALQLHPLVRDKLNEIESISIDTHESALRIIDKKGPLNNPADRDHCLQYMVACALIYGQLTAEHYEDQAAQDPRIDRLRSLMTLQEEPQYSLDYLDPLKRSIASRLQITLRDGSSTEKIAVEYPLGHKRRRKEALPLLEKKFIENLKGAPIKVDSLHKLYHNPAALQNMPVTDFIDLF